jgi:5-methylcytosine-specific restriction protein A
MLKRPLRGRFFVERQGCLEIIKYYQLRDGFKMEEASMPQKPAKPCRYPGCPNLTQTACCPEHQSKEHQSRPNANTRGYNSQWQKARKQFLRLNPLCRDCQRNGKLNPATVVDHIKPHRGDKVLFWDESNWQPLCKQCHDKKTGSYDRRSEYRY